MSTSRNRSEAKREQSRAPERQYIELWLACKFLIDRFRGKSFSEATGFDDKIKLNNSKEDEAEIERLKNSPPFNYILED